MSRQEARRSLMLDSPVSRLIPKMAIPTIVSMLVASFYNMADTFFVSMLPGDAAAGAVGINMSLSTIIQMFGMAIGQGANSYIARLLGAKREDEASQTLTVSFFTAFFIGAFMMVICLIFLDPLMRLLGAKDPAVLKYARDYASYILYASPFMCSQFVLNQCLRAEGSATYSMIGIVAGAIINCGLDPLFIFTFKMEVAGAALATSISQLISFFILLAPYVGKQSVLRIRLKLFRFTKRIVAEVTKMGFPSMMRMGLMTLATIVTNVIAQGFSVEALAAISVVNRIMMFVTSAILGYGQGFQPVAGYNYGAKRYDRVLSAYRFSVYTGLAAISAFALCVGVFSNNIMSAFSDTPFTVAIGSYSIRLQCLAMPFHAWCIIINMMYAGLGRAKGAALMSIARQGLFFIPMVIALSYAFNEYGLASAQAAADFLTFLVALPLAVIVLKDLRKLALEAGLA